jgi:hypothetical protein
MLAGSADKTIELRCRNLYDYIDDPLDYTHEENFRSAMNSFQLERDIWEEIDEQIEGE